MKSSACDILIVDPDEKVTQALQQALSKAHYKVFVAHNGPDALALINSRPFALYVLEITIPQATGFELCQQIRRLTSAPVLFLSKRGTELDKVAGLEIGADDYLVKPFGLKEFLARVRALLRRSSIQAGIALALAQGALSPAQASALNMRPFTSALPASLSAVQSDNPTQHNDTAHNANVSDPEVEFFSFGDEHASEPGLESQKPGSSLALFTPNGQRALALHPAQNPNSVTSLVPQSQSGPGAFISAAYPDAGLQTWIPPQSSSASPGAPSFASPKAQPTSVYLSAPRPKELIWEDIRLNLKTHKVSGPAGLVDLTPREFELLKAFMSQPTELWSREDLLRKVWRWEVITETKTVDIHVKRLRSKLKEAGIDPAIIEAVRGYGYRLR